MSTDLARRTLMQSGAAIAAASIVGAPALATTAGVQALDPLPWAPNTVALC